jgi:hypothetical protein
MIRAQIQLTEQQHRQLRRWARQRGISLAEAVRRCVAERILADESTTSRDERLRAALAVLGKYRDPRGRSDVAEQHDRYLAEAYGR